MPLHRCGCAPRSITQLRTHCSAAEDSAGERRIVTARGLIVSSVLALVAASALSTAAPAATVAPAASAAIAAPSPVPGAGARAVQYVQVQYRNVLKSTGFGTSMSQMAAAAVKSQVNSFVANVLQNALAHMNPVVALIANFVAKKVTQKLTNIPVNIHVKPNIKVVAEFEATTTIAPARTRTDVADISTIVQCDKRQVIVLDNTSKVYTTTSFDEMKDADAASFGPFGVGPLDTAQETVAFQPDDGTETIAGLVSHHEMISSPSAIGFADAKTDLWFADLPMYNACAALADSGAGLVPSAAVSASTVRIPLRSVQFSEMDFSAPTPAPSPSPSNSAPAGRYHDSVLDTPGIAWIETTSVTQLPYDAAYFDVPAGYTHASPEPSPTP